VVRLGKYIINGTIGSGVSSDVKAAVDSESKQEVAIKIMKE